MRQVLSGQGLGLPRNLVTRANLREAYPQPGQWLAPHTDLVTRLASGGGSSRSLDGLCARPARAAGWPIRGSSRAPWARHAKRLGWRSCWPGGRPAGNSTAGASGYAGRVRTVGRSGGTYVVCWVSSCTQGRIAQVASTRPPASEEDEGEEDHWEENPN